MPNAGKDVKERELQFFAGENEKSYKHFRIWFGNFLQKLDIFLPYNPAVCSLVFTQRI
jgi:hypothetical protein